MNRLTACGASLGLFVFLFACSPPKPAPDRTAEAEAPADASEVVARAGDVSVTADELDAWIKDQLFESQAGTPSGLYQLRSRYVEDLLTERLLDLEAQKRGVTRDQVIEDEVKALGPVTDQEVADFYDQYKERMEDASFEKVAEPIRMLLEARRKSEAIAAFRDRADIVVLMEPPRIDVEPDGPSKGPADAPVTIVEFSDFQCPFCRRAAPNLDEVLARYPNDVRLVYRHLPLRSHSRARSAAVASVCADQQGKFWAYHDTIFANPQALTDEDLRGYAEKLGLDLAKWDTCVASEEAAAKVDKDEGAAMEAGVQSTPTFLVNGILVSGALPPDHFAELIDKELGKPAEAPGT